MNDQLKTCLKWAYTLSMCIMLLAAGTPAFAQNVNFTMDRTEGCAPLTVSFTNTSDAGATAYDWNFGLGSNATTRDAGKIFTVPGTYNVVLTVTYPGGPKSVTKTVTVYDVPSPAFTATPLSGCTPLNVAFTDESLPGSGTIASVVWDFGDGLTSSDPNPSHTYTVAGSFPVSAIVTNSHGCTKGLTKPAYVVVGETPNVDFTADAPGSCVTPHTVNFSTSGPAGLTYTWDFGDGNTGTGAQPSHTYTTEGSFNVVLTAVNAQGCEAVVSKSSFIVVQRTRADFAPLGPVCAGTNVTLANNTTPTPTLFTWTLPDGSTRATRDLTYFFPTPGDYIFTLTTGLPGCTETVTKTITANELPVANFMATPPAGCAIPFNTQFTSTSTGATQWAWTFGDNGTASTENPAHTYTAFGEYDVTLTVHNSFGCEASVTKTDFITVENPQLLVSAAPNRGCIPLTTSFNAAMPQGGPIVSYLWEFPDGTTSTAANPSKTFTVQGAYRVVLTVQTAGGCTLRDSLLVLAGEIPVPAFDVTPKEICGSEFATFLYQGTPTDIDDSYIDWLWTLPEDNGAVVPGTGLTIPPPTHRFDSTGLHDVLLTVDNYGCIRTLFKADLVKVNPPIAEFVGVINCTDKLQVTFIDQTDFGQYPDSNRTWYWTFDDGDTSTAQSPVHRYAATGRYSIKLVVRSGSCIDSIEHDIIVVNPQPAISVDRSEICAGGSVTFARGGTNDADIRPNSWTWTWGDGFYAPNGGSNISKTYRDTGIFRVQLSAIDINGCAVLSNTLNIQVNGAFGDFTFTGRNCEGDEIEFTDQSKAANGYNIVEWTWDFGDGTPPVILNTRPVGYKHRFDRAGTYDVYLEVKDVAGCSGHMQKRVPVISLSADFQASPIACLNQAKPFRSLASGPGLTYLWDFGNGTTSTAANPSTTYTQPGQYSVTLTVTNSIGCTATVTKTNYITVPDPKASFTIPPNLPVCPPILVQLTNTSTGHNSSTWDFGDNSSSNQSDPAHVYNLPGTYTIRLTVYSEGNCSSTITQDLLVKGPIGTRTMTPVTGCVPHDVTFTAQSANAVKYIWDMDNGNVQTTTTNTFSYKYEQPGIYTPRVVLEDAQGCRVPAQGPPQDIIVDQIKADFVFDATQACDQGNVFFTDRSTGLSKDRLGLPFTYSWDFGYANRTDDVSNVANPTFFYQGVGTYQAKVTISSIYGCVDTYTQDVKVEPLPEPAINTIVPVCAGDTIRFSGFERKQLPGTIWSWTVDNTTTPLTGPTGPRIAYLNPGSHIVKLMIRNGNGTCPNTAQVTATWNPYPTLNVTPKQSIVCLGNSLLLQSNASLAQFTWTNYNISDPNSPNPTVTPTVDTTYRVTAVNVYGCVRRDSARITISRPFTVNSNDAVICSGRQTQLQATGAVRYQWLPTTGLNRADVPNPMAAPATTTLYRVIGYGNDACFTDTAEVLLTVNPSPELRPGPPLALPTGTELQLNANGSADIIRYEWFPNKFLSCADCPSPIATPRENITYNISATNQYGCQTIALLPIRLICEGSNVFIPNSFSPNGDGQNDVFYVRGRGVRSIKSFKIFNRWGQLIFERYNFNTDDVTNGWDGKFKGQMLSPDVYVYMSEMICDNGEPMMMKGNITLIR